VNEVFNGESKITLIPLSEC